METIQRRWYWAFAVVSVVALLLFSLSIWRDYNREWRLYQRRYVSELRAIASGAGKRELPQPKFAFLQAIVTPNRVDRCQMCHQSIDDPRFAKAPQPLTTHPKIPLHPFEKFGCTLCHQGQGRATTVADAHGRVPFWEEPLLKPPYLQAMCGACHRGVVLKEAPLIARGRQLYLQMGCAGCHRIHGAGGLVGPELTWEGDQRKDPEWHLKHFKDPRGTSPGSIMPPYGGLPKDVIDALTVYMLSLREAPARLLAASNVVAGTGPAPKEGPKAPTAK